MPHPRLAFGFGPLIRYAVELSGAQGVPRFCYLGTAQGDQAHVAAAMDEAGRAAGFALSQLKLFTMPNVEDVKGHLLAQDVIWVQGGSVANLLAVWQVHGLGPILRRCWQAGVVLAGVSAGSICWHVGGTTDSWGHPVRPLTNALGFVPYGNGVHYDSEPDRRPAVHRLVADGTLPTTYCTDDGVGLVYRDTECVEAVSERAGKGAYVVFREGSQAREERLDVRSLSQL